MGRGTPLLSSEVVRAARALLRWEQADLAGASLVSLPTIKRLESKPGIMAAHQSTVAALRKALEAAGVEFTNGDQPGVRLTRAAAAGVRGHTSAPKQTAAATKKKR
jgi:hypothetical protein